MTKQAVIAIVVGVLILLGAGGAFLYSKNKPTAPTTTTTIKKEVTPPNAMTQSVTDILSSGKNSKCTFSTDTGSASSNGIVFVSENKARGDFEIISAKGKTSTTHMIRTGDTFYMWGDSLPIGIKMIMNVNGFASKMQESPQANSFDPNKKVDFKCVTWSPDTTLFTPPTTVKFTSIQGMIPTKAMTTETTGTTTTGANLTGTTNQCNICTVLTGQAKTACMAQFKCK